ncbi:MAG: exodeoxyribonuclease VII large subunit, partial [Anaerolineales bacterium]
ITIHDLTATVSSLKSLILAHTLNVISSKRSALFSLAAQLRYTSPDRRIQSERQRVDDLARRALSALVHNFQLQKKHIQGTQSRLEALSPLAVLARGYAVVTRKDDGSVVSRVGQAKHGQQIQIRVSDGQLDAEIVNRKS